MYSNAPKPFIIVAMIPNDPRHVETIIAIAEYPMNFVFQSALIFAYKYS